MKRLSSIFLFLVCSLSCFAHVIINPTFERASFEVLHPHVDMVEIKNDSTKIYCTISYQDSWSYNIPKAMFLEDLRHNKKYQITKCIGLPFEPEERVFSYGGTFQFVFCFPYIEGLQKFNLIEDSTKDRFFNIYGIDISTSYPKAFEGTEYKRFKNMSDFYKSSGYIDKFAEYEEKELSAAQYIFGKRSFAADACYNQLAHYYNETGDYVKAIDLGTQALECDSILLGVENKEYPVYANTLGSLSQFYLNAGKYDESLQCILKSIRIRRNIEDEQGYLNELYNLLLTGHGNDGIIKRISIALDELESLPSFIKAVSLPIAELYKIIADNYSLLNDNDKAIEYCNKAISIMNSTGYDNSEDYAELLGLRCKYQRRNGLKTEAISFGEAAKQLYDSLNVKSLKYADLLDDLSWAYAQDLNYEKAIQIQKSAIAIYRNAQDWISLADAYDSMSNYYQWAEKLDEAENSIKEAIEILNEYNKVEQAHGAITGNSDNASNTLTANKDISMSNLYQTLAFIYQKQGKYTDAINAELERGKYIKNTMSDDLLGPLGELSYATHLMNLSTYYWKNNKLSDAIVYAEQCMKIFADNPSINSSQSKLQYSLMLTQVGDTTKAFSYAEMAVSESKLFNDLKTHSQALYLISYLYYEKRDYYRAEQCMADELNYLKKHISSELTEMSNEQKQRLWNQYEHFFLLYRSIIEKSDRNEDLLSKLYDYTLFSKNLLLDSEAQRNSIKESRLNVQWTDIQQQLSDDAIAIEFIATRESDENNFITYHALIIDKKHPSPRMITLYSESDLEEIKKTDLRNICDIVGELIWKPILTQYVTVKDIYFSPDGILHMLPIEYYSSDGTNCMSEHYNMYRLSSTKELIREMTKLHPNSVVLYGGLDYDRLKEGASGNETSEMSSMWRGIAVRGGFDPLYNTALETQEIKDLLTGKKIPTTLYSGVTGTEESFRNLSGQSHGIIHLATHGMYVNSDNVDIKKNENNFDFLESMASLNDPVKEDVTLTHSFLVMAGGNRVISRIPVTDKNKDGILTSKEISQLDLRGVDLVVLSACESALGDIDNGGVYGLQRGFKKAGANTILMSLDKVDDEATRILMVEFYRNLMSGKTKRQSLQEAQQYLRKVENGKYDDPKYWGLFIMLDGLN